MLLIQFCINILIRLNTGILHRGNVNLERRSILNQYLCTQFLYDVVSLIPAVCAICGYQFDTNLFSILLSLLAFFKTKTLIQSARKIDTYFSLYKNQKNIMDLVNLILTILSIVHIFSCVWHGVALYEIMVQESEDTWLHAKHIENANIFVRYVHSFYFTMVTVK